MALPPDFDPLHQPLRLSDLGATRFDFALRPGTPLTARLAERFALLGLRKLSFEGALVPEGRTDWRLAARLGATVVQPCRVTLAPVTTRIEEPVTRRYVSGLEMPEAPETEMPEDDSAEPLPDTLDLAEVMAEALALALPPYPRADDAEAGPQVFAEPGTRPMTDADARPFAGLASLRDALKDKGD